MRYLIAHYHILKNAGSTIEDALDRSFGHRFARFDKSGRDATIPPAELLRFVEDNPELSAVSSHHIRYPLPEAPGILFFDICILRDPIDRVRSMYAYYREKPDPGDPVSDLAASTNLGGFVAGMVRDYPLQIRNVQVNLIAAAGDSDEPTPSDLEVATERMLAASLPGVVDCFDESARTGQYFLRQVFPELDFSLPPVNVSARIGGDLQSQTDPAVFDGLVRLNQLDLALVERTRTEVKRRAALIPATPEPMPAADLFDAQWYLRKYPDVAAARIDPLRHYRKHGAQEGRKPHPLIEYGRPHRLFDPDAGIPLQAALPVTSGPLLDIDDVPLDPASPRPEQLRFVRAANPAQLRAQFCFKKR